MKFFDLTLPKPFNEENPKIHKIDFENFRKAYHDFPRELAESLVEKGMGKWVPAGINGVITVPQAMPEPLEFFFLVLPTSLVKAVHVNELVPSNGPTPNDMVAYGQNLIKNMRFSHDPADEYDADEYDASLEDDGEEGELEEETVVIALVDVVPDPNPDPEVVEPDEVVVIEPEFLEELPEEEPVVEEAPAPKKKKK